MALPARVLEGVVLQRTAHRLLLLINDHPTRTLLLEVDPQTALLQVGAYLRAELDPSDTPPDTRGLQTPRLTRLLSVREADQPGQPPTQLGRFVHWNCQWLPPADTSASASASATTPHALVALTNCAALLRAAEHGDDGHFDHVAVQGVAVRYIGRRRDSLLQLRVHLSQADGTRELTFESGAPHLGARLAAELATLAGTQPERRSLPTPGVEFAALFRLRPDTLRVCEPLYLWARRQPPASAATTSISRAGTAHTTDDTPRSAASTPGSPPPSKRGRPS
jgi:hypothetical protein